VDRGFVRATCAAIGSAALLLALARLPVGADQPAPQPSATSYGASIIEPLREIGRVKARTVFCKAFLAHAELGVSSALDFERTLLDTLFHFRSAKLGDELNKHKSLKQLEKDLNRLADLSLAGRSELEELKSLDTDPDRHQALVDFVNALNGAKGRQMDLARKLSRTYGIIAEQPVYSNVTLPGDLSDANSVADAFRSRGSNSPTVMATGSILDNREYARALELRRDLFDAIPGDEMVGRDLRRAAENGKLAMALGGC
jgi:hypothetical protein